MFSVLYITISLNSNIGKMMKDFLNVMKALSDPNRVKIVKMLQHKKNMCVCEIQEVLRIAQPTVSKHLKVLENSGLVDYKKDGLWVNYYLTDGQQSPQAASLLGNLKHWLEADPEIADIVQQLPGVQRETIVKREK